jgi:hypothetical protein
MEELETAYAILDCYVWLSRRWDETIFPDGQGAIQFRNRYHMLPTTHLTCHAVTRFVAISPYIWSSPPPNHIVYQHVSVIV